MFFPLLGAVGVVPSAETMLRKDLSAGAHRLSTWFAINPTLAVLPDACVIMVNLSITFWMGGVADDGGAYVTYMLAIGLIIGMFQACGLLLSVVFPKKARRNGRVTAA